MIELIKVIEQNGEQLISAKELHEFLEVKSKFADWVKNRIEKYGFELDFGWFNKVNVLRRFSPDDFVRSEYYREQIALKKEKEDEELIPDFTKLKVEKKGEIKLPSFAMDLGMGV